MMKIFSAPGSNTWLLPLLLIVFFAERAPACDVDADCGVGGTCIKREKRARGVCYGGALNRAQPSAEAPAPQPEPAPAAPRAATGDNRSPFDRALDAPVYGEDPSVTPAPLERELVPLTDADSGSAIDPTTGRVRKSDGCVTTNDCPAGLECIYRDPMKGIGECAVFE